ncbi:MAG TPA: alkaline phosphatase family protein [Candidatus Cybelea sp.]|nr:alkaline phosphatase family protein [Candidatus Cybelea sp.]
MRISDIGRYAISSFAGVAMLAGCGSQSAAGPGAVPLLARSKIQHIVLMVQESRTFNDLFATTKVGKIRVGHRTKAIHLQAVDLQAAPRLDDSYFAFLKSYRNGHMDGFNRAAYQYVKPSEIQPYFTLANEYALADRMFQTQGSGDFTAHQDLIRGGTEIDSTASLIDSPSSSSSWGCTSPPGTLTSLITTSLVYETRGGPYPCTNAFPSSGSNYKTLAHLLDAANVSWKYYTPGLKPFMPGALWNAFLVISSVYGNKSEWSEHISSPQTNILQDISNGKLPAMSWVIPDGPDSDHPGYKSDTGPAWVAGVVNAIGESSYWDSTAIIVVWDDWGGLYDPIRPPSRDDQGGPGFRVPMIVVSPYVPQGELAHSTYEFGSIVRFIEDTWRLGRLGTTDETSKSIGNMFDFHQSPRSFSPIPP